MLQELILTDDCLTFASVESFSHLFTSLKSNSSTSLTLIDISRNYLVDDNLGIHAEMIDALLNQADRKKFLETLKVTTINEDVEIAYMQLIDKEIEEVRNYYTTENLSVIVNSIDIKTNLQKIE